VQWVINSVGFSGATGFSVLIGWAVEHDQQRKTKLIINRSFDVFFIADQFYV